MRHKSLRSVTGDGSMTRCCGALAGAGTFWLELG